MRSASKYEILVPISELWQAGHGAGAGVSLIPGRPEDQARFIAATYDVAIEYDYRDRACVSLESAYKIRDARKKAEQELLDAHMAELIEAGRLEDWQKARDEFWRHNLPEQGRLHPIGAGPRGADAVNACRTALADQCVMAERAAGIPDDVQERLTWPLWNTAMAFDDSRAAYQAPTS